jgi:hypothetical protein
MRIEIKRIQTAGLCLAAVLALGAIAASSASAAELLARVAGGGSVAGVTFLSSATLPLFVTHNKGALVHCNSAGSSGLFLGPTLGDILVRFLGCTAKSGGATLECNTSGAGPGEIHLPSSTTKFHLGLAHLGSNTSIPALLVLDLPERGSAGFFNTLCSGIAVGVKYSVIGPLQLANGIQVPFNTPLSQVNLNLEQTTNGLQHLRLILAPWIPITPQEYNLEFKIVGELILAAEGAKFKIDLFRLSNGSHVNIELVEP